MDDRIRRRRWPHLDVASGIYCVTTCLANSVPAQGLRDIEAYAAELQAKRPPDVPVAEWSIRCWKLAFARRERWLDEEPSARQLESEALARVVDEAICHFEGVRLRLWAYVVMPSHYHMVFEPLDAWAKTLSTGQSPRQSLVHSIHRFSARRCHELLGSRGAFWQHEAYDHVVRGEEELERVVQYVENNPVKAGLCSRAEERQFGSACRRKGKAS